jgi:hypothetical protein
MARVTTTGSAISLSHTRRWNDFGINRATISTNAANAAAALQ